MSLPVPIRLSDEKKNRYMCAICLDFLREPVQLDSCGHTFCQKCILNLVSDVCPLCRNQFTIFFTDKRLQRELDNEMIKCRFCKVKISFKNISTHHSSCPEFVWNCGYCKEKYKECDYNRHITQCIGYPVSCQDCGLWIARKDLLSHVHYCCNNQQKIEITCFSCQEVVPLLTFGDHYNNVHVKKEPVTRVKITSFTPSLN